MVIQYKMYHTVYEKQKDSHIYQPHPGSAIPFANSSLQTTVIVHKMQIRVPRSLYNPENFAEISAPCEAQQKLLIKPR